MMSATFCANCGGATERTWRYCSKCGSPTGTTVPLAQPASSRPVWIIVGVIVVLLAVPVTGIIAAIAIPNFLTATQRAKQKRTMTDIRSAATSVEAYAVDNNTYPPYGASLDEIEALVSPTYIRQFPKVDGWNRSLRYHCLEPQGDRCLRYAFQSAGKDGFFEDLPYEMVREATNNFDCDILYADGAFVWYPEGNQGGR